MASLLVLGLAASTPQSAVAAAPTISASVIHDGLTYPWDVAFTPEGQMLVTERGGRVLVYTSGAVNAPLIRSVSIPSVQTGGEAGLMGIAVDIAFASNRNVYLCASRNVSGLWRNEVLRYSISTSGSWVSPAVLLTGMQANTIHNGCALEMDRFGRLWVTMGDAGDANLAQNPTSFNGKVLRINRDGSIPADNPILPGASGRTAVYSMGHRNPQGIAFRPGTDQVYVVEHGPNTDDEINLVTAGGNYGWPCYTGAGNPNPNTVSPPCGPSSAYLNPAWASGTPTLATSGLAFADNPHWGDYDGQLFSGQLKESDVRRFSLTVDGTSATQQAILFDNAWGRIRAVVHGPGSQLFLSTSNGSNDRIVRLRVVTPTVARIAGPDRYATATAISAAHFGPGVPVAYIATGLKFPDALAGAAAAAHDGGPLLLVTDSGIPASTAAELLRLQPGSIRVVGGPGVVSDGVLSALSAYTSGPVTRISGADRYQTAAAISAATFPPGVSTVYVATGATFPDALAAAAAAAHFDGPVLLTMPDSLPAAVQAELIRLNPGRVVIVGGTGAISSGVAAAVDGIVSAPVDRLAGANRYGTAAAVSADAWPESDVVYVATGANFPDGLAGGAAAAVPDVPLLLVETNAVPTVTGQELLRLHETRIVILGGTGVVSSLAANRLNALLATP
jgi:glucose/arabinose dehydrogenase/putative cell wall-binding protein